MLNKLTFFKVLLPASLIVLIFLGGIIGIHAHTDPTEMDTVAYLESAHQITQTGGVLRHIPNCFSGIYTEATQHPLYLLFLSLFSEQSIKYFVISKISTFALNVVLFCSVFWISMKIFGIYTAYISVFLMAVNATVIRLGTMVACETLLALCFIWFMYHLSRVQSIGYSSAASGVCAGLTFLTKSLGILTIPVFLCTLIFKKKNSDFRSSVFMRILIFLTLFTVVSSPLLIRNLKVYGTPLYSDSSSVLWIDDWHEYSYERAVSGEIGFKTYFTNHNLSDVATRLWSGITDRNYRMLIDGLKPLAFWKTIDGSYLRGFHQKSSDIQGLWGFLLLVMFVVGILLNRKNSFTKPSLFSLFIFLFFVGWFSKIFHETPPTRLLYCVLILIIMYAASGIASAGKVVVSRVGGKGPEFFYPVIGSAALFCVALTAFNFRWSDLELSKSYRIHPVFANQLAFSVKNLKPGSVVWVGDSFAAYKFYFSNQIKFKPVTYPKLNSIQDYAERALSDGISFAFLDLATIIHNYDVYGKYYAVHPHKGILPIRNLPEPFREIPAPGGLNRFYRILILIR